MLWSSGKGQVRIDKGWPLRRKTLKLEPLPRTYIKVSCHPFILVMLNVSSPGQVLALEVVLVVGKPRRCRGINIQRAAPTLLVPGALPTLHTWSMCVSSNGRMICIYFELKWNARMLRFIYMIMNNISISSLNIAVFWPCAATNVSQSSR